MSNGTVVVVEGDEEIDDPESVLEDIKVEEFCFSGWGICPTMPATMHMVYTAGYDDNFLAKTGSKANAENFIKQAMTHAAPAFCTPSLGTKISFERTGAIKHLAGTKFDSSNLYDFKKHWWTIWNNIGTADNLMMFGVNAPNPIWQGIASLGSICAVTSFEKANINMWLPTAAQLAEVKRFNLHNKTRKLGHFRRILNS